MSHGIPQRRIRALAEPAELPCTARAPRRLVVTALCQHPVEIGVDPHASHRSQAEKIELARSRRCPRCRQRAVDALFDDSLKPPASTPTTDIAKPAAIGTPLWPFFLVRTGGYRIVTWYSPKHPKPELPSPTDEQGRRLATLQRGDGREMRINLSEYQGHEYISMRLWERNHENQWWPTRRGCSVRLKEVPTLIEALGTLMRPAVRVDPVRTAPPDAGLATLIGSTAQIKWAAKIRASLLAEARSAGDQRTAAMIASVADATWHIANRSGIAHLKPPAAHQLARDEGACKP
jgi:hypothetical protein